MKKTLRLDGMTCAHCQARVEKALNALDGVSASVSLAEKTAALTLTQDVPDRVLIKTVEDAGYTVVSIA